MGSHCVFSLSVTSWRDCGIWTTTTWKPASQTAGQSGTLTWWSGKWRVRAVLNMWRFCLGSSCRPWMSSSQRLLNRPTLPIWWRMSTSTCEPSCCPPPRHSPVGASHSSCSCCQSSQGCAESKLRLAGPEALVQEESTLFPADQSEVQESGWLLGQHGQQISQRAAGEMLKTFAWLWKKDLCWLRCHSVTLTFLHCMQKDIPSEEIKTGEEDDDDNGDNLLKDSNDSESVIYLGSVLCSAPWRMIAVGKFIIELRRLGH